MKTSVNVLGITTDIKINALCLGKAPSEAEDFNIEGIYAVTFDSDTTDLSKSKLASLALDVFHSHVAVSNLDDFEFTVLDGNNEPIGEDENHIAYSEKKSGTVEKVDNVPLLVYGDDENLAPGELEFKYNPNGDGEHPKFTRS